MSSDPAGIATPHQPFKRIRRISESQGIFWQVWRAKGTAVATPAMGILFIDVIPSVAREIVPALERFPNEVPIDTVVGKHAVIRRQDFTIQ